MRTNNETAERAPLFNRDERRARGAVNAFVMQRVT